MNYTSINEAFTNISNNDNDYNINDINDINNINNINNNNENNNENNTIDAKQLLKDYKYLNKSLMENKNFYKKLEKQKEDIQNYKCNIYLKHQDIMFEMSRETPDIIDTNEMNDHIIKYIELFKNYSDKWINDYYNISKKKLIEDMEKQEDKLVSFRNIFINTTNEIISPDKPNKNLCPICFENEINMCAIPCGHTCCNECIMHSIKYHNSGLSKCLSCRNTLKEYIKMYISL